jgi:hypothetical protein
MPSDLRLKQIAAECFEVYDRDHPVVRLVPHDSGCWKIVDLKGIALDPRPYETPELALKYLPVGYVRPAPEDPAPEDN